jgi:hypothetical protein
MRKTMFLFAYGCLLATDLSAAPPRCKTVLQDGTRFEVCERSDSMCESLAKEQVKAPSKEWNGCAWPAQIYNSHLATSGTLVFFTHITIVPCYLDSERLDVTITFDKPHCGSRTHVRKDAPIIIHDGVPSASIDIVCSEEPPGVPTVEAKEMGGKKEASHSYK